MFDRDKLYEVFHIREMKNSERKPVWTKIGVAFANKDGSFNLKLNAVPMDGDIHMRKSKSKDQPVDDWNEYGQGS